MAHVKTTNHESKLVYQCGKGFRIRKVEFAPCILALDRLAIDANSHLLADIIDGETSVNIPIFIAPCAGIVERVFVNAVSYPSTAGAATIIAYKANIGAADTALNTAIDIDNPTAETAIDGALGTTAARTLLEGQLVYALVALSAATTVRSDSLLICVEWRPLEA